MINAEFSDRGLAPPTFMPMLSVHTAQPAQETARSGELAR